MRTLFSRTKTNPAFYADQLRLVLSDDRARLDRALTDQDSVDLLTWNVFASLDTHSDRDWLAHRLEAVGGPDMRAPVKITLWTGRHREPLLRPSSAYAALVRERARKAGGDEESVADLLAPAEVPVRVESPDVLCLVDTTVGDYPRGNGGRDRLVELVDGGLEHARRLGRQLAVAVVYASGTQAAADLSARVHDLRDPQALAAELAHRREPPPPVILREMSWQHLLGVWDAEVDYLEVGGQPVRRFREHTAKLGLR